MTKLLVGTRWIDDYKPKSKGTAGDAADSAAVEHGICDAADGRTFSFKADGELLGRADPSDITSAAILELVEVEVASTPGDVVDDGTASDSEG